MSKTHIDPEESTDSPIHRSRATSVRRERETGEAANGPVSSGDPVGRLHREVGNSAVRALVERGDSSDLAVGRSNDRAEREAERVARSVGRSTAVRDEGRAGADGTPSLDRHAEGSVDEAAVSEGVASVLEARGAAGDTRPAGPGESAEPHRSPPFEEVRIHDDARAARLSDALEADAFTHGTDIYFGHGRFDPNSRQGRQLLAHEMTHVAQQDGMTGALVQRKPEGDGLDGAAQSSSELVPPRESVTYDVRSDDTTYRVEIVGHASPRWRYPTPETPAERNLALSVRRARAVENAVRTFFLDRSGTRFGFSSVEDEHASSIEAYGLGQSQTLEAAGGDVTANDPEFRRVDVSVDVRQTEQTTAGMTQQRELSSATTWWAIKVLFAITGGEGVYASGGLAKLKNRKTNQTVSGAWVAGGGGGGLELPFPAAAPDPSWSYFFTDYPVTFQAFEDATVRFRQIDVGLGAVGYSWARFDFTDLMDEGVSVSGFVMNQWGAGGSVTSGKWEFDEPIPDPPVVTEEVHTPTETTVGYSFGHSVSFPTGSADLSMSDLDGLQEFVESLP